MIDRFGSKLEQAGARLRALSGSPDSLDSREQLVRELREVLVIVDCILVEAVQLLERIEAEEYAPPSNN